MNSIQVKLLDLLDEIRLICTEQSIPYCMTGRLAWDALKHKGYYDTSIECKLLMTDESARAFEAAFFANQPQNRVLERETTGFGEVLRYVAADTTLITTDSFRHASEGIAVVVNIAESREDGTFSVSGPKGVVSLSRDYTQDAQLVPVNDRAVPFPSKSELFFEELYGKKWKTMKYPVEPERLCLQTIYDTSIGFKELLCRATAEGLYDELEANRIFEDYAIHHKQVLKEEVLDRKSYAAQRGFVIQRFRMCKKLLPHKQLLLELWDRGKKDKVTAAFAEYAQLAKKYYQSMGKTLYFDAELFDLLEEMLLDQGWQNAKNLRAAIPERHRAESLSEAMAPYL